MRKNYLLVMFAALVMFNACSKEGPETPGSATVMEFSVDTRAAGVTQLPAANQLVRLYVGVNGKEEPGIGDNQEHLHLDTVINLSSGNSFILTDLLEQRYKLAFLCVPRLEGMYLSDSAIVGYSHDYNAQMVDYRPILNRQPSADIAENGHIYRKVVSRRAISGKHLTENITLTRLNGQIVFDMGLLPDQFENRVTKVEIKLKNLPYSLYIGDNDNDELIYPAKVLPELTFVSVPDAGVAQGNSHFTITLNLLPGRLDGIVSVYEEGKQAPSEFVIKGASGDGTVAIKRNTRTKLEFNGLPYDSFTVKYAGFDGSSIGVDDDQWNGWDENL